MKIGELNKPFGQAEIDAVAERFEVDPNSDLVKKKVSEFQGRFARAEAAVADVTGLR
jgi:hypothetical protein